MIAFGLLLQVAAAGGAAPSGRVTVGDTVWLERRVTLGAGQVVQPVPWTPDDPVEALGDPIRVSEGERTTFRYPAVIWRAGRHRIELPGPIVIGRDGTVDTLAPLPVTVEVTSVLPTVPADSTLPIQPEADIVPRPVRSLWPVVVLLGVAIVVLVPLVLLYRRRGKVGAVSGSGASPSADLPAAIGRWADAGERRAVASAAVLSLRAALAAREARRPAGGGSMFGGAMAGQSTSESVPSGVPGGASGDGASGSAAALVAECHVVLAALDAARFGADPEADISALAARAVQLERALAGKGAS